MFCNSLLKYIRHSYFFILSILFGKYSQISQLNLYKIIYNYIHPIAWMCRNVRRKFANYSKETYIYIYIKLMV